MIAIFCIVSILIATVGVKKPSAFLVVILGSFFPYYFSLELLGVKLREGGSLFIHGSFLLVVLIYIFLKKNLITTKMPLITINNLDKFYLSYYILWLIVFLINLDPSLFVYKPYLQAPYWLSFTFILPIILKPIYNEKNISDLIKGVEWLGYFAALIIFISLAIGVTSKETGAAYEILNLSETFRYAPIRGFFSTRQAGLLSFSIIIFTSRYMRSQLSKKEIAIKMPFIILCLLGTIFSGTRGIFVLLCIICFYLVISVGKFSKKLTALILVMIAVMVLFRVFHISIYTHLFDRVFMLTSYSREEGGINTRFECYETGLRNFVEQPLIGNGMSKMSYDYYYSHSSIISTLEDTGLLGFSIMCLMMVFLFNRCRWFYKEKMFTNNQFVIRNMTIFCLLTSNLYGTISTSFVLFFLIYIYYFLYRKRYKIRVLKREAELLEDFDKSLEQAPKIQPRGRK